MGAKSVTHTSEAIKDMKRTGIGLAFRLALGGAFLGIAVSNIIGSWFGVDTGLHTDIFAAGAGWAVSFGILVKALHLFG
jgi:hypothetical protein